MKIYDRYLIIESALYCIFVNTLTSMGSCEIHWCNTHFLCKHIHVNRQLGQQNTLTLIQKPCNRSIAFTTKTEKVTLFSIN